MTKLSFPIWRLAEGPSFADGIPVKITFIFPFGKNLFRPDPVCLGGIFPGPGRKKGIADGWSGDGGFEIGKEGGPGGHLTGDYGMGAVKRKARMQNRCGEEEDATAE
jgi:hypothetical protein